MTGDQGNTEAGTTTRRSPIAAALTAVGEVLDSVIDYEAWQLDETDLQAGLADALRVRARVEELVARLTASAVDRDLPRLAGASSTRTWLMSVHGLSRADAARLVAEASAHPGDIDGDGESRRHAEVTRVAWAAGDLSAERAVLIATTVDRLAPDIPADRTDSLQADLAQHSRTLSYAQLQQVCRHSVDVVDPDGVDALLEAQLVAEEARALQATEFWMRHAGPGLVRIGGLIPTLHADMLTTVLDAHTSPRHHPTTTTNGGSDGNPYAPTRDDDGADQLTYPQRRGRAFLETIEHLPGGELPQHGATNATIVVTLTLDQLTAGVGEAILDTGTVISTGQTRRLACNAHLLPAVLDGPSKILDLGLAQRLFSRHQHLALAIRDQGCIWPGCDRPPSGCEAHHIQWWSRGGPTDIGCLLCPFHHHLIHQGEWAIRMAPTVCPTSSHPPASTPTNTPDDTNASNTPPSADGLDRAPRLVAPSPATCRGDTVATETERLAMVSDRGLSHQGWGNLRKRLIVAVASLLGLVGGLTVAASPTPATELAQAQGSTGQVWASVSAGEDHTCGIRLDHTLWCWGANADGQLGLGDQTLRRVPTQVGVDADWAIVRLGSFHTCALRLDQTLWCWGYNGAGQLGLGDTVNRLAPTQIEGDDWALVQPGGGHTCGVRLDHTLWCWGLNNQGQLGLDDTTNRLIATRVGVDADWGRVQAGVVHSCATRIDHTLWCWGDNIDGELGLGDTTDRLTPTQVGVDRDWHAVRSGSNHSCGIRLDHTLWCWGQNYYGELGVGDENHRYTPTRVGADADWAHAQLGDLHTCGIRLDHTLWCWGYNAEGQLGIGGGGNRSNPVQVGRRLNWARVGLGGVHSCGVRFNHTLWCWGSDEEGQLGLGDRISHFVPTRV